MGGEEKKHSRSIKQSFIQHIYADHNNSNAVKKAIADILHILDSDKNKTGLNIGSGDSKLHKQVSNLDIADGPFVDYISDGHRLPFPDDSFDVVLAQESLEHFEDPFKAVCEIYRVLRPNGRFYVQLPFIIGYHPGPTDFWRFSKEGIRKLVEQAGFNCECVGMSVGPATGLYRISVEFFATFFALLFEKSYLPAKGLGALLFYPIKMLDLVLMKSPQCDRIAGGYYAIARKYV